MVFERHPEIKRGPVTGQELAKHFGKPLDQIAAGLFPEYDPEKRNGLMDECCLLENVWLAEHGGTLYPDEMEVLDRLAAKVPLFIVSNCQKGYIESFLQGNGTRHFFQDWECPGVTGLTKGENISLIIERNSLKHPAYVGDTQGDADGAGYAQIPFIYAAYGFGSVDAYDLQIRTFAELDTII